MNNLIDIILILMADILTGTNKTETRGLGMKIDMVIGAGMISDIWKFSGDFLKVACHGT